MTHVAAEHDNDPGITHASGYTENDARLDREVADRIRASVRPEQEVAPPTHTSDYTAEQAFESCNGFDEIAIKQRFGMAAAHLPNADPNQFLRAMVFVEERRRGLTDGDAWQACQAMTLGEAFNYFQPEPDDGDALDGTGPTTAAGKG